jgi:RNA polymerase sigma-70 factor (ECF subfamily)
MKGSKPDAEATATESHSDSVADAVQPGWSPMEYAAEQQALEFCKQGRKEAFRPLVDAYFVRLVRVARAVVGDAEEARDLVQEAFIAAYRAIDTFTPGRPFYPWMRGILLNRCKVYMRTRRRAARRSWAAAERPGHWVLGATVSPAPERRRTSDLVRRAMAQLHDDDRDILILKHIEGYSYDELAETLGIGAGTVASRLYRARGRLKQALEKLDPSLIAVDDESPKTAGDKEP